MFCIEVVVASMISGWVDEVVLGFTLAFTHFEMCRLIRCG